MDNLTTGIEKIYQSLDDLENHLIENSERYVDLKQFVQDVISTESIKEHVEVNYDLIVGILSAFVEITEVIDQIKKNGFYGKAYDLTHIRNCLKTALDDIDGIMNVDEKQLNMCKTTINRSVKDSRLIHAILGMATESGELVKAMLEYVRDDQDFDEVNLAEEFADGSGWYTGVAVDAMNIEFSSLFETVINKLKARYPNGFDSNRAINRNLSNERKILEEGFKHEN